MSLRSVSPEIDHPKRDATASTAESGYASSRPIPVLLLAGRDRGTTRLPEEGQDHHLLRGYKALELEIEGRPLIVALAERLLASGGFGPVWIAGPERLYRPLVGEGPLAAARVVDTDGDFGQNLEAGVEAARAAHVGEPLAVLTSDLLPEPDELEQALADYRAASPCDFWMCEIRIPADLHRLGHSAWKPKYHIRPKGRDEVVPTLPGHLVIVDPAVIRLQMVYRIFELAYRTRNQTVAERLGTIIRGALSILFREDVRRLLRGRLPSVSAGMLYHGLRLGSKLRQGAVSQEELEDRLRALWVDDRHRARHPERRGRVAILDGLSLARDIDTIEEAREILGTESGSEGQTES